MSAPKVVAVTEAVPTAGAIIWWRLSGSVPADILRAAWVAAGLDEALLPSCPSAATALRRTVNEQRAKHVLVRPLGKQGGFALVEEREVSTDAELDFEVVAKLTLDTVGRLVVDTCGAAGTAIEDRKEELEAAFNRHQADLAAPDISAWLSGLMATLDALSLRESGGVYFVPHTWVDQLAVIVSVLHEHTDTRVHRVPALHSDDAVDAVLDALSTEAEAEVVAMQADIAAATLGERGFANRITRCDTVEKKVARYEELLGRNLDTMRDRLDALRAQLTVALCTAQATTDAALDLSGI